MKTTLTTMTELLKPIAPVTFESLDVRLVQLSESHNEDFLIKPGFN